MVATPQSAVRVFLTIGAEPATWMQSQFTTGGPFAGDTHAIETALQRLMDEMAFIRKACEREGVKFEAAAFWNLYREQRESWSPNKRGRPYKPEALSATERIWVSLRVQQQAWMDEQCRSEGVFESPSHLVDAALRHLRALQPTSNNLAGVGFPFDATATWKRYQRELSALKGPT